MNSTKAFAVIYIMLGITAIVIPYFFATLAVMVLGGVILASGIVSLFYMYYVRRQGFLISVSGPWVQVIAGLVILVWPELTLWLIAVLLGAGLILKRYHRIDSNTRLSRDQQTCYSQDRAMA